MLQKTANGIHKRPDYQSTNISFISSHALKLKDFVEFVCVTITFLSKQLMLSNYPEVFPNEELVYLVRFTDVVCSIRSCEIV